MSIVEILRYEVKYKRIVTNTTDSFTAHTFNEAIEKISEWSSNDNPYRIQSITPIYAQPLPTLDDAIKLLVDLDIPISHGKTFEKKEQAIDILNKIKEAQKKE